MKKIFRIIGIVFIVVISYYLWIVLQLFIPNNTLRQKIDIGNNESIKIVFSSGSATVADYAIFTKINKKTKKKYRLGMYRKGAADRIENYWLIGDSLTVVLANTYCYPSVCFDTIRLNIYMPDQTIKGSDEIYY